MQRRRARSAPIAAAAVALALALWLAGPAVAWAAGAPEPAAGRDAVPAAQGAAGADPALDVRPAGASGTVDLRAGSGAGSVVVDHGESVLLLALGATLLAMGVGLLRLAHRPDAHLR